MTDKPKLSEAVQSPVSAALAATGGTKRASRRRRGAWGRLHGRIVPGSRQDRLAHSRNLARAQSDVIIVRGHRASS